MKVACEWGLHGLKERAGPHEAVVIVDVLSFSTTVDVATSRGAAIYPYSGEHAGIEDFAASVGAVAGGRRSQSRYSLSPMSFLSVGDGAKVAVRSVNGGRLTESAGPGRVISGCLRNAAAVAGALRGSDSVLLVPAGEQWPDRTLRACVEDRLGAGAIASCLTGELTPEAELASRAFESSRSDLQELLLDSRSGQFLVGLGFADDVELASELNVSEAVPELREGAYVRAGA